VQSQGEGPRWTLHQWNLYWEARRAASREPAPGPASAAATAPVAGGSAALGSSAPPRRPADDEADSSAVRRKRSAEEEAAAQQLKGISAESRRRLLEVAALPLAGTPLEVGGWGEAPAPQGCCQGWPWQPDGRRPGAPTGTSAPTCLLLLLLLPGPAGRGVPPRRRARRGPGAAGVAGGGAWPPRRRRAPGDEPRGRLRRLPPGCRGGLG
jgi:hypothetical protein